MRYPVRSTRRLLRPVLSCCALFACALGASWAPPAMAEEAPLEQARKGGFWSVQFENDVWGSGDDRFYSHGTEFAYLGLIDPPGWLSGLTDYVPFFDYGDAHAVQYSLGQKIFTPQDTEATQLLVNDRPYAGWTYFRAELLSRVAVDPNPKPKYRVGNLFGVTLGVVGPSSHADDVQKGFHDLIDVAKPKGWDNQLKDELGIILNYTRKWQYFHDLPMGLEFETSPHVVGALGNVYTYAGGGVMLRFGQGLRNDLAPPNIRPGFPGVPYLRPNAGTSWYLFTGLEGRAMARNIFLDGNTFRDSHSVDKKPFVADFQFGIAMHINTVRIALSNVWRSKEFDGQEDNTQFGAINVSFFTEY